MDAHTLDQSIMTLTYGYLPLVALPHRASERGPNYVGPFSYSGSSTNLIFGNRISNMVFPGLGTF